MNERFEALKNNSIVLRSAQLDDEGNYFCTVLPQNITQNVVLTIEKAFSIRCDGRDVLDRSIVYRQGESHVCECKSAGGEESNIKWFLNVSGMTNEAIRVFVGLFGLPCHMEIKNYVDKKLQCR